MSGGIRGRLTLAGLDYHLPEDLVAQTPAEPRHASRLLAYDRATGALSDHVFIDLPDLLRAGDVLVRNDTRVFPARAYFRRASGGRIEVLFLNPLSSSHGDAEQWEALLRGRPRPDEVLECDAADSGWRLRCVAPLGDGRWTVESLTGDPVLALLQRAGHTPLPPYITASLDDPERYQTTYARRLGSAAAPTAGLHFTPELDAALAAAGVTVESVTLHVGLGTFKPLRAETLRADSLHAEPYEIDAGAWTRLRGACEEGRRIIAVGTTSLRVLEHLAREEERVAGGGEEVPLRGETSLFVRPGYEFLMVGGLVTNFHLPRTSLLALVMAFCGIEETRAIYRHAVRRRYRFYSFGDAMVAM